MQSMLRLAAVCCWCVLLLPGATPAAAQDYVFGVPEMKMLATVNADASVKIEYDISFRNNPAGHPIDVVDIGTPHSGYDLGNVRASIGGHPLPEIRPSEFVKPGFEVHLGQYTIPPGGTGTLHVEFTMPNMVYQDTTRADYASLRITPTWFGEKFVKGITHLQVAIQLPASVKPDEALYQDPKLPFSLKAASEQVALVGWDFPGTRLTGKHLVGVSFPKRDLHRVIKQSAIDLLVKWFEESPQARVVLGIAFMVLLAIVFFRFSGGTGISLFVVVAVVAGFVFYHRPGLHLLAMPVIVVLLGLNEWLLARRKARYMPPIAQVEGGGIKRGLTAPEAAVLLELPVAKVLSLVVFGMLKKGILRQVQAEPLLAAVNEPFLIKGERLATNTKQRADLYREAALKQGVVVHNYEHPFLFLIQNNPAKPLRDIQFALPMKMLITSTADRMKGFDLSDTKDYYRSIVRRATEQAAAIGDVEQRQQTIDRNFEWILMGDDYGPVFDRGPVYRPIWMRGGTFSTPSAPSAAPSAGGGGKTSFGDVAASFSGWAENTMGGMASSIAPGSLTLPTNTGGFLNLSGADHVAGEFFKALGSASGGGGGGGGGGCACAGCACACACAGGGR